MVDWALFERWTELRGKLKALSRQRAEAAETSRLLAEASVSLELELSKLEVERSKELAALFRGLGEAYATAPTWQEDEHTRVGLGDLDRNRCGGPIGPGSPENPACSGCLAGDCAEHGRRRPKGPDGVPYPLVYADESREGDPAFRVPSRDDEDEDDRTSPDVLADEP